MDKQFSIILANFRLHYESYSYAIGIGYDKNLLLMNLNFKWLSHPHYLVHFGLVVHSQPQLSPMVLDKL